MARSLLDRVQLRAKLVIAFLVLSLTPFVLGAIFTFYLFSKNNHDVSAERLTLLRSMKRLQLTKYLDSLKQQTFHFVGTKVATNSMGRFYGFTAAFKRLDQDLDKIRRIMGTIDEGDEVDGLAMEQEISNVYRHEGGYYSTAHRSYHPGFINFVEKSDFDDVFLVNLEGDVLYSVRKDKKFATNLQTGAFAQSHLAKSFRQVLTQTENRLLSHDTFIFQDFQLDSATQQVVAYMAWPLLQRNELTGVAVFQLPVQMIHETLAERDEVVGKESSYLVGTDHLIRSNITRNSELLTVAQAFQDPTTNKIDSVPIQKALAGETGIGLHQSYGAIPVLSAYGVVNYHGSRWAILVELKTNEIDSETNFLKTIVFSMVIVILLLIAIIAFWLSKTISKPIADLTSVSEVIATGDLNAPLQFTNRLDDLGRLARSFAHMRDSIREKIDLIKDQNTELEQKLVVIKQQNEDLQIADQLKNDLLANTSHELRTPINGIIGITESILNGAVGEVSEQLQVNLTMVMLSGRRLSNLVNDLLDLYKIQYHDLKIYPQELDFKPVVSTILELSSHLIKEENIQLVNTIPDDLPLLWADSARIEQVLYNLIGNAIKYTASGTITVAARVEGESVYIEVLDTGMGIDLDQFDKIFQPLTQVDSSKTRSAGGSGLGLSITKQLVELHGGQLVVTSQKGKGSCFAFDLPLSRNQPEKGGEVSTPVDDGSDHSSHVIYPYPKLSVDNIQVTRALLAEKEAHTFSSMPNKKVQESENQHCENLLKKVIESSNESPLVSQSTILVVDDDPINLQVMKNYLSLENYHLLTAQGGNEALEMIKQSPPDLVLLDIMMPDTNGYEVCETLRKRFAPLELPVIMLTASSQLKDLVQGFRCGANDYLIKPCHMEELYARVKHLLQAKSSMEHMKENQSLKLEISHREAVEKELQRSQQRLLKILDNSEDAILCTDPKGNITFFNEGAKQMFHVRLDDVMGKPLRTLFVEDVFADYQALMNPHLQDEASAPQHFRNRIEAEALDHHGQPFLTDVFISSFLVENEWTHTLILRPFSETERVPSTVPSPEQANMPALHLDLKTSSKAIQNRVQALENALNGIRDYLQVDGQQLSNQLREIDNHLEEVNNTGDENEIRQLMVDLMCKALACWEETTGESKVELAQKSQLWKAYLDRNTWQTRTLNKYFSLKTLPKNPRYKNVILTALYVVDHAESPDHPELKSLKLMANRLQFLCESQKLI